MNNWFHLRVLQQEESANNSNYINLKVFQDADIDANTIKNVLRVFSATVFKDLVK